MPAYPTDDAFKYPVKHRFSPPSLLDMEGLGGRVTATGDEGLQVSDDEAQRVQDNPGNHDSLKPLGCFFHCTLVSGDHPDQQCNSANRNCNDGADSHDLTIPSYKPFYS